MRRKVFRVVPVRVVLTLCFLLISGAMLLSATAAGESELKQGLAAYKARDYRKASDLLNKALTAGCSRVDCYWHLAGALYGQGKTDEALKIYREIAIRFAGQPASKQALAVIKRIKIGGGAAPAIRGRAATSRTATGLAARIRATPPYKGLGHPPVRKASLKAVREAVDSLPAKMRKELDECGASICISPSFVDRWPDSIEAIKKGTHEQWLCEAPGRIYDNEMNIYEHPKEAGTSLNLRKPYPVQIMKHTALNECFQVYDDLHAVSKDPALRKVYNEEKRRVPQSYRTKLATYLKSNEWGPRETCSDLFGSFMGGGSEFTDPLYRCFPRTRVWLEKRFGIR